MDKEHSHKHKKKHSKGKDEAPSYISQNYKRFLESRTKKIDQFVVNSIGWAHVLRSIEVIGLSMRDLVYKIIPSNAIIRDLKTSQGKIITKES